MTVEPLAPAISFNLWREPWIGVGDADGRVQRLSIEECLLRAHELRSLYDPSPLVVCGVQRLLAAITQAVYDPRGVADVAALIASGRFDADRIADFGKRHGGRFDLFSLDAPFLQTGDAPLLAAKGDGAKTVAYLGPELPAGTAVVHWHHAYDQEHRLCPACAAAEMVTLPAFATAYGRGVKPSINGVPPLYVLPAGDNLFEALALSVIAPSYQPAVASEDDSPAWDRSVTVARGTELFAVGYLESLTFPARRIRLHPGRAWGVCSRCGLESGELVTSMLFEMGHSRPKDAPSWLDPFVAYRVADGKAPSPVRPLPGKAAWREYAALFLTAVEDDSSNIRPMVISQAYDLAEEYEAIPPHRLLSFRCIGLRTDMKAKVFEWVDAVLGVPAGLLGDETGVRFVQRGIENATTCGKDLTGTFARSYRPETGGKRGRHDALRLRMEQAYWADLAAPFRDFVQASGGRQAWEEAYGRWIDTVLRTGMDRFKAATDLVGDRGADLRRREQAIAEVNRKLGSRRKEWLQ